MEVKINFFSTLTKRGRLLRQPRSSFYYFLLSIRVESAEFKPTRK